MPVLPDSPFNWALAAVKANMQQRAAEKTYGLSNVELTPALGWNLPALRRDWNQRKRDVAPWWSECSKEAFNTGLDGLARGLNNWSAANSGKRAGKRIGFPRFKTRRSAQRSVRFTTGTIRIEPDRRHVTLPRLGTIKTHESTRKLARRLDAGTARILAATVRFQGGRWFCAFTVEVVRKPSIPVRPNATVGIDLGISTLGVLSNGQTVPNPRHMNAALRKLRTASRALSRRVCPDPQTGRRPSMRWVQARERLRRRHARVANLRRNGLHMLTTRLTRTYGTIVIEDLNVAGMLTNHRIARHVLDASFGEFRRQLEYKTQWYGGRLVVADRWYPSSKTCSACGVVKPKLPLQVRTFNCNACGLNIDRDLNAAINLKHYVARSGLETQNGRGADQKTGPSPAGGDEAPTPHRPAVQDGDLRLATDESLKITQISVDGGSSWRG